MDLDGSHEIPIEEPLEVVVAQEVAVETNPTLHVLHVPVDGIPGCHGDQQPIVIHIQDQPILAAERSSNDISAIQQQLCIEVQTSSSDDVEKEWKDSSKRLRDMMKKRALRQDKEYRKKECVKAKERMANRRNDPAFREMERQKDRERRAQARRNKAVRDKERQRDVQYKRKKHSMMKQKLVESNSCQGYKDSDLSGRTSSVDFEIVCNQDTHVHTEQSTQTVFPQDSEQNNLTACGQFEIVVGDSFTAQKTHTVTQMGLEQNTSTIFKQGPEQNRIEMNS